MRGDVHDRDLVLRQSAYLGDREREREREREKKTGTLTGGLGVSTCSKLVKHQIG